jgi:hypothetical protein
MLGEIFEVALHLILHDLEFLSDHEQSRFNVS